MDGRLTSGYTFVIHEVTNSEAKFWVGALKPSVAKPHHWRLQIKNQQGRIEKQIRGTDNWLRPFDRLNKRFYQVITAKGLQPGTKYTVEFQSRVEHEYQVLETAYFSTLPSKLPGSNKAPFTVGVGSCFYTRHDGGRVGQAYQALYEHKALSPDIKFLTGDQVYLDIGMGWYPLNVSDTQDRIADDYAESWELLRSVLRRGGTWMLPDDHEFWNNYPYLKGFNPYLITLDRNEKFRKRWESAAAQAISTVQQVKTVRLFDIGSDLSFCVADLRTERWDGGFISSENFNQMNQWASNLKTPGVLVIPQPLIAKKGDKNDYSLPHWEEQYNALIQSLASCNHDVIVLAGDVHYGRVAEVKLGNSKGRLIEVITSPLSNLSELNGIAAAKPNTRLKNFPVSKIPDVPQNKIKYRKTVSTESKWWDIRYPVRRTTEHFMTVDFQKVDGKITMKIHAWDVRNRGNLRGLPKSNFTPVKYVLR